jgi:hypothetical protein
LKNHVLNRITQSRVGLGVIGLQKWWGHLRRRLGLCLLCLLMLIECGEGLSNIWIIIGQTIFFLFFLRWRWGWVIWATALI